MNSRESSSRMRLPEASHLALEPLDPEPWNLKPGNSQVCKEEPYYE
jgi:hypothetical protein